MASQQEAPEMTPVTSDCKKRKRRKNFSAEEENAIQAMFQENAEILNKKFSNEVTNKGKAAIWQKITDCVNNKGVCFRTVDQVKEKWGNMAQKAKKTFSNYKMQQRKTGGGPPPLEMSQATATIIESMKDTASFSGVPGGMETEISPCETVNLEDMEAMELVSFSTNNQQTISTDPESGVKLPASPMDTPIECSKIPPSSRQDEVQTEKIQGRLRKSRKTKHSNDDVLHMQYQVLAGERENQSLKKEKLILEKQRLKLQIELLHRLLAQNDLDINLNPTQLLMSMLH
ncbi:myb/SANT-like DNA-binding domain-containing protein 4 [Haliotis rubra]|uniref:myb/SANT-like DNA-binding domain-containing protein 4 n=1 Tax=Haliotis rubra TaxID=36100 RepID=UPI001EE4FC06|nr:myb/SANT-like DNA-binding domain-containing protein 4 [Haliotis rubra]